MAVQPTLRIPTWRWIFAAVMVALSVYVQRDGWWDIVGLARHDEESSHILLVPIVAAWLVWVRRDRLRSIRGGWSYVGTTLTAIGAYVSYWGVGHSRDVCWHGGTVLMAIGAAVTVLGTDFLIAFFPVFLIMAFLVPVPSSVRLQLSLPLERWTAQAVELGLQTAGVAVERSGNLLVLNGQKVTVAEACNGLHMIFGLWLVIIACALGMTMRWSVRVLLIVLSPIITMALNFLRLIPTTLFYGYASHDSAAFFHDAAGWVMLPLACLLIWGVQKLLKWMAIPVMAYSVVYP